ncbi:hypothetical protein HUJ04_012361 [Dendroctonus ponderosae]|uniref:PH domain-containing protein n=1 Tax=Dendroctonus ponderosae TaxID=77166 RepID=A0AAR5PIQ1_DENPD|nr:hypothetical protein HUJ04_012361 [Dendroctonus ponderosae]
MGANQQEIYLLLKDIYEYLNRNIEEIAATPEDRQLAEELIKRSKSKLQIIALTKNKLTRNPTLKTENESCVRISKITVDENPPLPSNRKRLRFRIQRSTFKSICPFKNQPAKELPKGIKQGTLSMHRKVFSIDRLSKVFGVVHGNWLLLYWTEKNVKPFRALDLELYEAREDRNDANSTMSFTVFSPTMSNKEYNFLAITHKDMLQWVAIINETHERLLKINTQTGEHNYEDLRYFEVTEQEGIYSEINNKSMPAYEDLDEIMNTPPKLPAKSAILVQSAKIDYNDQEISNSELKSKATELCEELEQPYDDVVLDELNESIIAKNNFVDCSQPNCTISAIEGNKNNQRQSSNADRDNSALKTQQMNENGFETDESYIEINSINCEVIGMNVQELGAKDIDNDYSITSSPLPEKETSGNHESRDEKVGGEPNRSQINKAWNNLKRNAQNKYLKSPHLDKGKTFPKENSSNRTNTRGVTDKALTPHHTSNIVQIIRKKFVPKEYSGCSLGTFSRNSKLETFQARPQSNCNEANNVKYLCNTTASKSNE